MTARRAVITGASRGLGRHLAERFWREGFSLVLVARDLRALEVLRDSLPPATGRDVELFACDFADAAQVARFAAEVTARWSRLDALVNNAAIQGPVGPLTDNDPEAWAICLQVNLLAPVALCRAFIPLLAASGAGAILNLSGGGATGPRPNFTAYASAKAGLARFGETLAGEVAPLVTVNALAPGAMKTAMLEQVLHEGRQAAGAREYEIAAKVFEAGGASMDAVADLAVFLCSDRARRITGKLISAVWDKWADWPDHADVLEKTDLYTLRRITGRDRDCAWGDK
ncbi:3-oxoacyl-[acyl-carrier protein] reductase [Rhodoblastus sphagnicola]|uniref:SDR family NAD(P)-dependent oxidoreductase n=1 Tax=Rhodoblastus sphagnicola TaxID=333368 RepID=UPI001304E55E|nr:SDR family oxidoreductase [Rhodoblastus sphagnicola]MBB4198062.1 3-oxoacyl-[acyl-carrier protein] reductase [Rhodoblastus sphagnicola]